MCVFSRAFRVSRVAQLIDWYLAKRKVARLVYVRYILFLSMHSINNIEHNIYKKKTRNWYGQCAGRVRSMWIFCNCENLKSFGMIRCLWKNVFGCRKLKFDYQWIVDFDSQFNFIYMWKWKYIEINMERIKISMSYWIKNI